MNTSTVYIVFEETIEHGSSPSVRSVHASMDGARNSVADFIKMNPKGDCYNSTPWSERRPGYWVSQGGLVQTIAITEYNVQP